MIAYFDTSALVPLFLVENGTPLAIRTWLESEQVISSSIAYVEAQAALAAAIRSGRVAPAERALFVDDLEMVFQTLKQVDVDEPLIRRAGVLAEQEALRGYDAIHLASAEAVADEELVVVAGDGQLLAAAQNLGFTVIATAAPII